MIRKQVYIEDRQEALLKQRARQLGVTEAELVRQGLDRALNASNTKPNAAAWQRAIRAMHQRRTLSGKPRSWKRDDLYVDRLSS